MCDNEMGLGYLNIAQYRQSPYPQNGINPPIQLKLLASAMRSLLAESVCRSWEAAGREGSSEGRVATSTREDTTRGDTTRAVTTPTTREETIPSTRADTATTAGTDSLGNSIIIVKGLII